MNTYNNIMRLFWLILSIALFIIVTYMCITKGFDKWAFYYVFVGVGFLMYFMKTWMMKRVEKHMQFLKEKQEAESKK